MNAFEQGYQDFLKGKLDNPYNPNTTKGKDWQFGFNKAYFRNLEKATKNEDRRRSQRVQGEETKRITA